MIARTACLIALKWAARSACGVQCRTCELLCPVVFVGDPREETPEGLYHADRRREARRVA
jgi:hypothetical protein